MTELKPTGNRFLLLVPSLLVLPHFFLKINFPGSFSPELFDQDDSRLRISDCDRGQIIIHEALITTVEWIVCFRTEEPRQNKSDQESPKERLLVEVVIEVCHRTGV